LARGGNGTTDVYFVLVPRYLAEFDFRYNHLARDGYTHSDRTRIALPMVAGKRLRYAD
jgi:hypothetical protein